MAAASQRKTGSHIERFMGVGKVAWSRGDKNFYSQDRRLRVKITESADPTFAAFRLIASRLASEAASQPASQLASHSV